MSDLLVFAEGDSSPRQEPENYWKVLVVDDEESIHQVTRLALHHLVIENRGIKFLDAYSGSEAKNILSREPDIAMVFLDVIMETETAGLDLVDWIRNNLGNKLIRIVLRTGQPGAAPEEQIILRYDINDYKEKTELVRSKLFSTTCSAIRNFKQLRELEEAHEIEHNTRRGLEKIIKASANLFESNSLHEFASGILQQTASLLHLREDGLIVKANGINAIKEEGDFTVLAQIGRFLNTPRKIPADVRPWIEKACTLQKTIVEEGHFVGYFVSPQGQIDILYFEGVHALADLDNKLIDLFGNNIASAFDRFMSFQRFKETQTQLLRSLAASLDRRKIDSWKAGSRLSKLCCFLGETIGLAVDEVELIELLAPLHDIGLSAVSESILNKEGPLSTEERTQIQRHPEFAQQFIRGNFEILEKAAAIIYEHHEHFDGTGYPRGLQGLEISLPARVVGISDACVALSSERPYRQAWSPSQVFAYLKEQRGVLFDPGLVDVILQNQDRVTQILTE